MDYTYGYSGVVAEARADDRAAFIRRTYAHLAGAILAFTGIEFVLIQLTKSHEQEIFGLLAASRFSWLIVMLAFMGASWLPRRGRVPKPRPPCSTPGWPSMWLPSR